MRRVLNAAVTVVAVLFLAGCVESKTVESCSGADKIEKQYSRASTDDPWTLVNTDVIPYGCVER